MRRSVFALALLVTALALPQAASAKALGPIRVVAESGKVGWIRGAAAKAWWAEMYNFDPSAPLPAGACLSLCDSPAAVSKFELHFLGKARWPFHENGDWPTGMLLIQSGHRGPWLYYPASRTTPPFLVSPGGNASGAGDTPARWDAWKLVTPRMERLIEAALKNGSAGTSTRSAGFPTGWVVAGVLGSLLLLLVLHRYTTTFTSWRSTGIVLRGSPPSR
jgi:hypothetical protein